MEKITLWTCSNCGSTKVQQRVWVEINSGTVLWGDFDLEISDLWCDECGGCHKVEQKEFNPECTEIIGFQVTNEKNEIHPDMDASFCVYSLSDCRAMLNKSTSLGWKLTAIYKDTIEEPTMMFKGNPRQ